MAYVSKELAARVRKELKETFGKDYKFSVINEHHSCLNISLMSSHLEFNFKEERDNYSQLNHFYLQDSNVLVNQEQKDFFKKVNAIANDGNFDKSDSMTDYFHVGWYVHLSIGKWDKPYVKS